MLKENINIDDSYTDRVVRQLVDETEIDFKTGKVHLPATDYSWPFHNFGPGGLENALTMKKSSNFAQHILTNYGVDDEEFKGVLTKYIGVIDGRIRDGLVELIDKRDRENPHWLQENKNIDWDYTDTIVNQLVDETEIDYEYEIPHISAFPDPGFYIDSSFNMNLDLSENLFGNLFNSFWRHCRNVYGLTDPEIQKVWWPYKKEILKKIKWKGSLNESTEDNFLDKIVNQLVDETQVFNHRGQLRAIPPFFESDYEDVELEGRATGVVGGTPLSELIDSVEFEYSLTFVDFKYYCKQMYGLTWEECHEVWDKYREALYNTDFSHLYTPNIHLNESTEDNFLDKIVDQLVSETIIDYDNKDFEAPFTSTLPLINNLTIPFSFSSSFFSSFLFKYCREVYGLTAEETWYVWQEYEKIIRDKINNKPLNESTEGNFLDKIVNQLVDETIIEDDEYGISVAYPSWIPQAHYMGEGVVVDILLDSDKNSVNFVEFRYYANNMYGLDEDEIDYVWDQYRSRVWDKDQNRINDYQRSLEDEELNESKNESTYKNYLGRILQRLVDETIVEYGNYEEPLSYPPWIVTDNEGVDLGVLLDSGSDHWNFNEFSVYVYDMYGLTEDETKDIWETYLERVYEKFNLYITQNNLNHPWRINESKEDLNDRVHTAVNDALKHKSKLRGQTKIKKYFMDKGLNKQDADEAMVQYLSKQQSLHESPDDLDSYIEKGVDKMVGNTPYIHKVVKKMVDNTHLIYEKQTNTIMAKLPFYIIDMGFKEGHIDTIGQSYLVHPTARIVAEIRKHLILIYGMDKWEADAAALMYLSKMTEKINDYKREGLNESEDKKEKYLERVLDHLVSGTKIKKEIERDPVIMVPYLHVKSSGNVDSGFYLSSHIFHGASSYFSFLDYGKEVYGLSEYESEILWKKYVEILRDKIKHQPYKLDESVDLSYTDDKDFPFLNQLANHTMNITEIGRNAVLFPFIDGYISDGNFHKYFNGTPYDQLPFEATLKLDEYLKDFGLTENEKGIWWDIYLIKVIDAVNERDLRIIDSHGELYESTEDNHLDKIANSMYKESPPDKFPFDSQTISFTDHVKNVYGISGRDATYVYYKFRILKGWSTHMPRRFLPDPLNEHAEPEDPIYNKIANTLANESEIVISPAPYNKMFLRSPAWKESPHIENVIDQLTGRIKDVVPDRFVKHLKEIYNIKYPTFVNKVWELYRDKMLERIKIKQAQQRQIIPKQQKFFDHILKTLVAETEVQTMKDWLPDDDTYEQKVWVVPPFLNHGIDIPGYRDDSVEWSEFSFFGYGYHRYMKDIYGLTDEELRKLWSPYYKALEKKIDEVIERDRIIYGDD